MTDVLPASAGMIPPPNTMLSSIYSAPRIRGDDPLLYKYVSRTLMCSPHPRG